MWIFQNNSFLSVVEHKDDPARVLVRSRIQGDIERAIPGVTVHEDRQADYRYRTFVTREQFKAAMSAAIDRIQYPNFKDSVAKEDHERKAAYLSVWQVMAERFGAWVGRGDAS
jgi:hypothetical protein